MDDTMDEEEGEEYEEHSESEVSVAFTNSSLAYTISETEFVTGWLEGKSPHGSLGLNTPQREPSTPQKGSSLNLLNRQLSYGEDENKERGNWTGRMDFVLSMLGYAVGLGNIWRFPYLCYRNGGGAFIFPYLLMLVAVGIPLFYLEVCLGQFCSRGSSKCWDFSPIFKGVGIAMIVSSCLVSIYYNVIIAWAQYYLFASFTDELPWSTCDNAGWNSDESLTFKLPLNSPECSLNWPVVDCEGGVQMSNGTCYRNNKFQGLWNISLFEDVTGRRRVSPSEEYLMREVFDISSGIFSPGLPRWHLTLSLLLAWIVTFLCLLKGIKSTGKVVYFTALFPYVVLVILFFRGVTLASAGSGVSFYIVPDFARLGDAQVWKDAATQIFYSLGPAWGGLITLASYNRFHNNALRDTLIVGIGNSLTSLFGGFVIFSYLGHMAAELKVDIDKVVTSGPGLAFIVYPEAVTHLPGPPFWSILFFFMLILLGLDSQFAMVETVLTGILDQWPKYREKKIWVILALCIALFLLGLPLTTNGGPYMLNLMDTYAASWSLLVIGLIETIAITYVYGVNRFLQDMEIMFGSEPSVWWKICWMVISPCLIVFILLFACIDHDSTTYGDYIYPAGGEGLGWLMVLASLMWIPICAWYKVVKEEEGKTFREKLRLQSLPNKYWGPALVKHRRLVNYVEDFVLDPEGDKQKLAYVNQAFHNSTVSHSLNLYDDGASLGTRDMSMTSASFDGDFMFVSSTSRLSLETSV